MAFNPVHSFATVEDMARECSTLKPDFQSESTKTQSKDFCEFSFEETVGHAINGWAKGKAYMQKVYDHIKSGNFFAPLPTYTRDVAGAYPIAAIAAAGDPFCMIEPRHDLSSRKKVLTFRINLGMNCNWTSEQVYNYGGALLAWLDRLEVSGFSIEADGYFYGEGNTNHTIRTFFGIKKAGQAFDLNRMGFALVHTGPLRRFQFRLIEQHKTLWDNGFAYGYGRSAVIGKEHQKKFGYDNEDTIWISGRDTHLNRQCSTPEGALKVFKDQIKEGCKNAGVDLDVDAMIAEG